MEELKYFKISLIENLVLCEEVLCGDSLWLGGQKVTSPLSVNLIFIRLYIQLSIVVENS